MFALMCAVKLIMCIGQWVYKLIVSILRWTKFRLQYPSCGITAQCNMSVKYLIVSESGKVTNLHQPKFLIFGPAGQVCNRHACPPFVYRALKLAAMLAWGYQSAATSSTTLTASLLHLLKPASRKVKVCFFIWSSFLPSLKPLLKYQNHHLMRQS